MSQNGAEMGRDARDGPRWAEMLRDAPRWAEMLRDVSNRALRLRDDERLAYAHLELVPRACGTCPADMSRTYPGQVILSSCHAPAGGSERARVGFAPAARLLGVALGRLVPRTRRELVEQADLERDSGHHP